MIGIFTPARTDRVRTADREDRPTSPDLYEEYVRRLRVHPGAFLASIPGLQADLEAGRQRLLRHQAALNE